METIDNESRTLKEELVNEIREGSILSIAAESFSIYTYDQLKKELENIDEFKFIFTSPTFIADDLKKKVLSMTFSEKQENRNYSELNLK